VSDEGVTVEFDQGKRVYQPGEMLAGGFFFSPAEGQELQAVEISVLWFTEGKGDEDMAVHHFQRISFGGDEVASDPPEPRFSTRLPRSPLSYEGVIVKIRWCVRVRVFFSQGRDVVGEAPFQLGDLPVAMEAIQ